MKMKFNNGKFKILMLADIHGAQKELKWTFQHIEQTLNEADPNLVVLLGDNITGRFRGASEDKIKSTIHRIGSVFEQRSLPFALVFGNHDHEGLSSFGYDEKAAKEFIMDEFKKFSFCVAEKGEAMTGLGNYNIPLMDSKGENIIFNLWFMDSNPYAAKEEGGGYGYVHSDQIAWYEKAGEELKKENGGENVPSFLFQHIIVPEIYEMLQPHPKKIKGSVKGHGSRRDKFFTVNKKYITEGSLNEGPCSPDVKSSQFSSWLKRGDISAAFFGHDHINDFSGNYKGIALHQVPSAGFQSYGNNRGSRTVTLYENDPTNYETKVVYCDDICNIRTHNPFVKRHGYHEWITRWKPIVLMTGTALLGALLCMIKCL